VVHGRDGERGTAGEETGRNGRASQYFIRASSETESRRLTRVKRMCVCVRVRVASQDEKLHWRIEEHVSAAEHYTLTNIS
jgi:hypothetical protein